MIIDLMGDTALRARVRELEARFETLLAERNAFAARAEAFDAAVADEATKAAEAMREAAAKLCDDRAHTLRLVDRHYHGAKALELNDMATEIRALPLTGAKGGE